jgi:hypothetical protein
VSDRDLQQFVREALASGQSRDAIRERLTAAGWPSEEVASALDAWAETDFPIPVPRRRPYLSARETFLYLVMFVTLYVTAYNVGVLAFQFVERWLPDPALTPGRWDGRMRFSAQAARGAVAGLLIAYPVFVALSTFIGRALRRDPAKRASRVRKWLTYLTLFVAALVILGDLTVLVARLLEGELAPRFLAKTLVVAAIAGYVFGHYLADLRQEEDRPGGPVGRTGWAPRTAAAVVVITLAAGLWLVGTPQHARRMEIDTRRVRMVEAVASQVDAYYDKARALPPSLDSLMAVARWNAADVRDPVTSEPYGYSVLDSTHYQLCATFDTADSTGASEWTMRGTGFWAHGAGRHCWRLTVPTSAVPPIR